MQKPIDERNQTDAAKLKLRRLAKNSGLDLEFVTSLANFTWDYDPCGREATGWVNDDTLTGLAKQQLKQIASVLGLAVNVDVSRERAKRELLIAHKKLKLDDLWPAFNNAVPAKNYSLISEFASCGSLRGLSTKTAKFLSWGSKKLDLIQISRYLFLKLFRGGAMERHDLAYLWCDLVLELPNRTIPAEGKSWIYPLLKSIKALPKKSGLKDLEACCKGLVDGDKFFKQEVLNALTYAGVIQVNRLDVHKMFIAQFQDEETAHFYSNEWQYPLRFWGENGGSIDLTAVPKSIKA